jgi:Ca2+-binding EF-hand superfamily protein
MGEKTEVDIIPILIKLKKNIDTSDDKKLSKYFKSIDINNDNYLNEKELKDALKDLGYDLT